MTGQFFAVDGLITGEENMLLMADLHHLGKRERRTVTAELLERFDLTAAARKPASTYSGGMKRRLDLAMTLVGGPRILFLDEPTTGLDPRSRHAMWQLVRGLVRNGTTVFLTTQYLEEADGLADRIAVLHEGRIAAEGSAEELKRLVPGGHVRLRFTDPAAFASAAAALPGATGDEATLTLRIPGDGSQRALRTLLGRLDASGAEAAELTVHTPDLDDVFFAVTEGPALPAPSPSTEATTAPAPAPTPTPTPAPAPAPAPAPTKETSRWPPPPPPRLPPLPPRAPPPPAASPSATPSRCSAATSSTPAAIPPSPSTSSSPRSCCCSSSCASSATR
ncbi:antibiotic resistance ATP-binding protein [Streptomyces sp. SPB074]|nr:antibiotic resistance ATP-binding protein [Streptomyces sp. SPB074]